MSSTWTEVIVEGKHKIGRSAIIAIDYTSNKIRSLFKSELGLVVRPQVNQRFSRFYWEWQVGVYTAVPPNKDIASLERVIPRVVRLLGDDLNEHKEYIKWERIRMIAEVTIKETTQIRNPSFSTRGGAGNGQEPV